MSPLGNQRYPPAAGKRAQIESRSGAGRTISGLITTKASDRSNAVTEAAGLVIGSQPLGRRQLGVSRMAAATSSDRSAARSCCAASISAGLARTGSNCRLVANSKPIGRNSRRQWQRQCAAPGDRQPATSASGGNRCASRSRNEGSGEARAGAISRSAACSSKNQDARPSHQPAEEQRQIETDARQISANRRRQASSQKQCFRESCNQSPPERRRHQIQRQATKPCDRLQWSAAPAGRSTNRRPRRPYRSGRSAVPQHPPDAVAVLGRLSRRGRAGLNHSGWRCRSGASIAIWPGAMSSINRKPAREASSAASANALLRLNH